MNGDFKALGLVNIPRVIPTFDDQYSIAVFGLLLRSLAKHLTYGQHNRKHGFRLNTYILSTHGGLPAVEGEKLEEGV